MIPAVSSKLNKEKNDYIGRITGTVKKLKNLSNGQSNLQIFGHHLVNCHSVYIADNQVIFSPYFLAPTTVKSPVFEFVDRGEKSSFQNLKKDVEALKKHKSTVLLYSPMLVGASDELQKGAIE